MADEIFRMNEIFKPPHPKAVKPPYPKAAKPPHPKAAKLPQPEKKKDFSENLPEWYEKSHEVIHYG